MKEKKQKSHKNSSRKNLKSPHLPVVGFFVIPPKIFFPEKNNLHLFSGV
jgi:hypothetical protein